MAAGDVKRVLGSDATITIAPENVASSTTRVAGVESTAIAPSDPVLDCIVEGLWTAGTSPTVDTFVDVWVYASFQATPVYPDTIDGTASAETLTSENVRNAGLRKAATIRLDNTSDRAYRIAPFSIASLFGGQLPKAWGLFITHNSGVNSHATSGNHVWKYTPVYANVAQS
jgi:hypothetical protein